VDILIVIDMQHDFIDGALGTDEARAIVRNVNEEIARFRSMGEEADDRIPRVIYTLDTHDEEYLSTQEGHHLPVEHCIRGSHGWELAVDDIGAPYSLKLEKPSFGTLALPDLIRSIADIDQIGTLVLAGVCTDICVVSNALILKAAFPELPIAVKRSCCAGSTPRNHARAIATMACCQVESVD